MPASPQPDLTVLLRRIASGDQAAEAELLPQVYDELRRLARACFRGERTGHTLQPTALVHEAYLRLVGTRKVDWQDRQHFFAVAAQVMRRVLVDHARQRTAAKRGGGRVPAALESEFVVTEAFLDTALIVHELLDRLKQADERQARIVEMRFFGGLNEEEIALILGVSSRTVIRDWKMAKAWMAAESEA